MVGLLLLDKRTPLDAASAADAGKPRPVIDRGRLKRTVTRKAIVVTEGALKQSGKRGLSRARRLRRHHRGEPCGRAHTPQDDGAPQAAGALALKSAP